MIEYMEMRVKDPYHLTEALNRAAREGWRVICPLSVGTGYLLEREVS